MSGSVGDRKVWMISNTVKGTIPCLYWLRSCWKDIVLMFHKASSVSLHPIYFSQGLFKKDLCCSSETGLFSSIR